MFRILAVLPAALALATPLNAAEPETAILAGGCFWCVESDFDAVPGVLETVSGFAGGGTENPTYEEVSGEDTGHREAVQITYDPDQVGYETLLDIFFRTVDPLDGGGQFCDRGESYTTAIFPTGPEQRKAAEAAKARAEAALGEPVATTVEPVDAFWPAEDYHQDYYEKNAVSYRFYRWSCGRNDRVEEVWGDEAYRGVPEHG